MDRDNIRIYKLHIFKGEDTIRKSFTLSKATAEKWKDFVSGYSEKASIMDCALTKFMEECADGKVGFEIDMECKGDDHNE